jgi:hypothetical protein
MGVKVERTDFCQGPHAHEVIGGHRQHEQLVDFLDAAHHHLSDGPVVGCGRELRKLKIRKQELPRRPRRGADAILGLVVAVHSIT